MKMKRIAAMALALAMGISTLGLGAYAEETQSLEELAAAAAVAVSEEAPEPEPAEPAAELPEPPAPEETVVAETVAEEFIPQEEAVTEEVIAEESVAEESVVEESVVETEAATEAAPPAATTDETEADADAAQSFALGTAPAGDGTKEAPYRITSAADMQWFAAKVNGTDGLEQNLAACATLTQDIDLSSVCHKDNGAGAVNWTPPGTEEKTYTGVFDGGNHTISGLYFSNTDKDYVGLFGAIGAGCEVKNVTVADSYVEGRAAVGGVCGYNNGGTITNCTNHGPAKGIMLGVGGVCGYNNGGSIMNCTNNGTVSCDVQVGGVCGYNGGGSIMNCTNSGAINTAGGQGVGGVCGYSGIGGTEGEAIIRNCFNTGSITVTDTTGLTLIGGVSGCNAALMGGTATIEGCFSVGAINVKASPLSIGGVSGCNAKDDLSTVSINNCYFDSNIYSGNAVGSNSGTEFVRDAPTNVAPTHTEGKPTTAFATGEVAWLLNTTDGTATNSKTWAQGSAAPQLAKADKSDVIYRALFLPKTGDAPVVATSYLTAGAALTAPAGYTWPPVPAKMPAEDTTYRSTALLQITTQPTAPAAKTVGYTDTQKLTVAATTALTDKTITYRWKKDGAAIAGATAATYSIPTGLAVGSYVYTCDVSCDGSTVTTTAVTFIVKAAAPTASPKPTATAAPTPTATPAPTPTATPAPTATPTPTATPAPDATGFVNSLYTTCLDRKADTSGEADWVDRLVNNRISGTEAAYGFVFSKEFQSKAYSDEDYIEHLYTTLMGRKSDAAGKADWVAQLESGKSREDVFYGFANSAEFEQICSSYGVVSKNIETFVSRFYKVCLDRAPDASGLADWSAQLRSKEKTGRDVAYGFIFSPEFRGRNFSDEDYVEQLYAAFMGRTSDPAGKADWVNRLKNGKSREEVFNGFVGSKEFSDICTGYDIARG